MIEETDRGFTLGDGLFETVLVDLEKGWDGSALLPHADRMTAGCHVLGLPAPPWRDLFAPIIEAAVEARLPRAALRLTWSAGPGGRGLDRPQSPQPRMTIGIAPAPMPGAARLVTAASVRRNRHSPASRLKTLSYIDNVLARAEAIEAGGDEAVMLNGEGMLACAAAANLFWISDGRVFTPALDCGVLAGIARARLMAAHPVEEALAGREALDGAQAVFLTNSLTGVRPVMSLDGRRLEPHPLVAALAARVA